MSSTRWLAALTVVASVGCFNPVSEGTIGPEGGELRLSGAILTVPPGALADPIRLTIAEDSTPPPMGTRAVGKAFKLGPSGLVFEHPLTLELPMTSAPATVQVVTAADGSRSFETLPTTNLGFAAQVSVSHFSIFIPVTPDEPDAGSDAGVDATDSGVDSGTSVDSGVIDAGFDAGFDAGGLLETCQANWSAINWWTLSFVDDGGVVPLSLTLGETSIVELPGAYVFTIASNIYAVDRTSGQLVAKRETLSDTLNGGSTRMAPLRFADELRFASGRDFNAWTYDEWKVGLDGRLTTYADGGFFRELAVPVARDDFGPSRAASVIASWDAISVAAVRGTSPAIAIIPRDPSQAPWTVPLPAGFDDSSAGLALGDGTVLFLLNTSFAPPTIVRSSNVYALTRDGGLTPATFINISSVNGAALLIGPDAGPAVLSFGNNAIDVFEPGFAFDRSGAEDAGALWPVPGSQQSTPGGRMLSLVTGGGAPARYGPTPSTQDLYLFSTPGPAVGYHFVTPLLPNHRSYSPPGIGALRDDSFVLAFYDDRTTSLYAARLCLPP